MKKEIRSDVLLLILNLVAIFFIINPGIFSVQIPVGNFYIYLSSLVAALLIVALVMLKNNYKTNLVLNITNLELPRIVTIFVYNFIYISFVVTFMVTVQIPFLVGIVLLTLEFIALLAVLLINLKAKKVMLTDGIIRIRDILFIIMLLVLALKGMPFVLLGIPASQIAIAAYLTVLSLYVYKLYINLTNEEDVL